MSLQAKGEAKGGGGGSKGGDGDYKGGGGGSKAEAKGGNSSRELDTRASDADFDSSSDRADDIADIAVGAWCLVKRSDGSWKYGTLFERKENTMEIIVDDEENTKLFSVHQYDGKDQDPEVRALDVGKAGAK